MNSIYSTEALQRILDHWGVGRLTQAKFLGYVGRNIWFHAIDTTQGRFELYSYLPFEHEYANTFLNERIANRGGTYRNEIVHSFDQLHQLSQVSVKHRISLKQVAGDLEQLKGQQSVKAFRVIGAIMQLELANGIALYTYGSWVLYKKVRDTNQVLVDTREHGIDQMDRELAEFALQQPTLMKAEILGDWLVLSFSGNYNLHFCATHSHPAAVIIFPNRKVSVAIESESEIYYQVSQ